MLCRRTGKRKFYAKDILWPLLILLCITLFYFVSSNIIMTASFTFIKEVSTQSILDGALVFFSRKDWNSPVIRSNTCSLYTSAKRSFSFESITKRHWVIPSRDFPANTTMSMSLFLTQSLEVLWNVQTDKNCSGMIKHQNIEVPLSVYPEMEPINFLPKHTGFYNFTITSKNDPISFQQNLSISTPNYHNIGRHLRIRSSLAQNSPLIVVGVPGNATYCEFTVLDSPLKHVSIVLLSCLPTIVLVVVILLIPAFYSVATFSFYQCYYPCCVPPLVFQQSLQLMEQRKEVEFQERHPPSQRCPCSRRKRKVLSAEQMLNLMYEDNENSMEPLLDFSEDEEDHSEQLSMQDISTRTDNEEETDGHL